MENFVHIEKSLLKALNKCHTKLNQFKNGEVIDLENWNKWHDLNDKIEERIKENIKNYHSWHFDQYGWNAYNF